MVSWTTHDPLSLDWGRWVAHQGTQGVMNGALSQVLDGLGFQVLPFGAGGAWIVTGRKPGGKQSAQMSGGVDRAIRVSTAAAVSAWRASPPTSPTSMRSRWSAPMAREG